MKRTTTSSADLGSESHEQDRYEQLQLQRSTTNVVLKEDTGNSTVRATFRLQHIPIAGPFQIDGLSEDGTVFGFLTDGNTSRGFAWSQDKGLQLMVPPITQVLARNASGEAVVYLYRNAGLAGMGKLLKDGTIIELTLPSSFAGGYMESLSIAEDGIICGKVIAPSRSALCIWTDPDRPDTFPLPAGMTLRSISGLSDSKVAVGSAYDGSAYDAPYPVTVDYQARTARRIDISAFSPSGTLDGVAIAISRNGRIAGFSPSAVRVGEEPMVAFYLDKPTGVARPLGTRKPYAFPSGVDNSGNVVGQCYVGSDFNNERAFYLKRGTFQNIFYDLTDETNATASGWKVLGAAKCVNSKNQVCGYGIYGSVDAAFFLTIS